MASSSQPTQPPPPPRPWLSRPIPGRLRPRPLSPWAQRFGYNQVGREPFVDDPEAIHSGLAPEKPRLHPKFYSDNPILQQSEPETKAELDKLFVSELWQRVYLKGLESWENGPLMRYVKFSDKTGILSGGHLVADYGEVEESQDTKPADSADPGKSGSPANPPSSANSSGPENPVANVPRENMEDITLNLFHTERIQVDESKWLSFLRKDRWYDLVQPEPLLGGAHWSIDNPKVWEIMSISIELVNRMINALIEDKHMMLETLLFGLLAEWDQISPHIQKPSPEAHVLLSHRFFKQLCENQDVPCDLDFIPHLTTEQWRGRLDTLCKNQTWTFIDNYGGINGALGITWGEYTGMITMDVGPVRNILRGDATLAERCILHLTIATTFVDFDGAAEVGFAAEMRIFGGVLCQGPSNVIDLPFGAYLHNWPYADIRSTSEPKITFHPAFQQGVMVEISRYSALQASKLLSAAFWDDQTIPDKSTNYFHSTPFIHCNTPWVILEGQDALYFNNASITSPLPALLDPEQIELLDDWNVRHSIWASQRQGWYLPAREKWINTAWAFPQRRSCILDFARGFARRDELECRIIAEFMVDSVNWRQGRAEYLADLPPATQTKQHRWIWHAIGLLMLAALPIRDDKVRDTKTLIWEYHFKPSKTATSLSLIIAELEKKRREEVVLPSRLSDPLTLPPGTQVPNFEQRDYLDVMEKLVLALGQTRAVISRPWLRELTRVCNDLRQQRGLMNQKTHMRRYVDRWDFRIPTYDPIMVTFDRGAWVDVP
ncbi:hypothetical protein HD806DRAFT_525350 [Xylariaceae sp. AK1471]|nr:hypothetical protein HD806DRAFT_525350 [Xylariaceae sp. AK1471]